MNPMASPFLIKDSPGVPVSATSKELFRGFSYVAPVLKEVAVGLKLCIY